MNNATSFKDNESTNSLERCELLTVQTFAGRRNALSQDLAQLARDFASTLRERPEFRTELKAAGYADRYINRLEAFGQGNLLPEFFEPNSSGANRIASLGLPVSVQAMAVRDGVNVLEANETDSRMIPLHELTPAQAQQAIDKDGVRSLAQQRTWLREQKRKITRVLGAAAARLTERGPVLNGMLIPWELIDAWNKDRKRL